MENKVKKKGEYLKYIKYRSKWEHDPVLKDWIAPIPGNPRAAYCKFCQKGLQQWCTRDLYKHASTLKHKQQTELHHLVPFGKMNKFIKTASKCSRITTSDGQKIIVKIIEDNGDTCLSSTTEVPGIKVDPDDDELIEEPTYFPEETFETHYKDWLQVDGTEVTCIVCKYKLKGTKLGIFKHSMGKIHTRNLMKKSVKLTGSLSDSQMITTDFRKAIDEITIGNKCIIDLRDDSSTTPGLQMIQVMKKAKLGDDYFHNDENVNNLQKKVARLLRKDAGLIFPTDTMANIVAVMTHCWVRDSQIIMGDCSLQHLNSSKTFSKMGRIPTKVVENMDDGTLNMEELQEILKSNFASDFPQRTIVCVENAHMRMGGKVLPIYWLHKLRTLCDEYNGIVHMDGSRYMNAALVYENDPHLAAIYCDSTTFSLNTGLGSPMGTVLVGSSAFIQRAQSIRNMLGGLVHQIGFFAAAGLYALGKNNLERLLHDHEAAKKIALSVHEIGSSSISVQYNSVHTNIVHLYTNNIIISPEILCRRLKETPPKEIAVMNGRTVIILATPIAQNIVQLMTHIGLSIMDIELIMKKIKIIIHEYDE